MFENSGLDLRFLSDVHNISTHLKEISELLKVVLVKVANDGIKVEHPVENDVGDVEKEGE